MNPYDDDNMFLRHIRQQIQDAQKGNLLNERLLESVNRPSNIQSPFFTKVSQGDPGRFASPQPLQFPGSTIPKTVPPPVPNMGQNLNNPSPKFNLPYNPDPRLINSPFGIDNILQSIMGK